MIVVWVLLGALLGAAVVLAYLGLFALGTGAKGHYDVLNGQAASHEMAAGKARCFIPHEGDGDLRCYRCDHGTPCSPVGLDFEKAVNAARRQAPPAVRGN